MSDSESKARAFRSDAISSIVVFIVAVPLCLGIAQASNAPLSSGLLAGILGGLVVGSLSGSHTSVAGPAAGLTAIVIQQQQVLGSFDAFLLAVLLSGLIQIGMGAARAGGISAFFPSSVIRGLLAAIGVILILKQIPHLLGHDTDPEGDASYLQPDGENTFSEIFRVFQGEVHAGAIVVGLTGLAVLIFWQQSERLKNSLVPGSIVVVALGIVLQFLLRTVGGGWLIEASHLVEIPIADGVKDFVDSFFRTPDFSQWSNPDVWLAAVTLAVVASLETLLSLEAVDKLDPQRRDSPPNRELMAQGTANAMAGMIGALPVTSVIVRSSVNVSAGARTKRSAILHGVLLLVAVLLLPTVMNQIPKASLAAVLIMTGYKLASPQLFARMYREGRYQFMPFLVTLVSIVLTDLLTGILIGLGISVIFILNSNLRFPIRRIMETHIGGNILHIELASQVSFLNRAALDDIFGRAKSGSHILIDATDTDYIDPDILSLIRDFRDSRGPARGVEVSLRGFRRRYELQDQIQFADYSARELRDQMTPDQVLTVLKDGNQRFCEGQRITRDFQRQIDQTKGAQTPMAAVISCIDSRVPAELVFDLGIGDIFSLRVAGNVLGANTLGSLEYAVVVAGVKLVVVLGHTRCGAVTAAIQLISNQLDPASTTGCQNIGSIVTEIENGLEGVSLTPTSADDPEFVDQMASRNVLHTVREIRRRSTPVESAESDQQIRIVGALYNVASGEIVFLDPEDDES